MSWPFARQRSGSVPLVGQSSPGQAPSQRPSQAGVIAGPLASGATVRSGDLVAEQFADGHTRLTLRGSTVEILADTHEGERYTFYVEPRRTSTQRVVRIASTFGVRVTEVPNPGASAQLICHQRQTRDRNALDTAPLAPFGEYLRTGRGAQPLANQPVLPTDNEFTTSVTFAGDKLVRVTLEIDGKGLEIDARRPAGARFAYNFAPEWSGPGGTERAVNIIATPGVRVQSYARPPGSPAISYGRQPVADVIYVQNAGWVPAHGQTFDPSAFLAMQAYIGTDPGNLRSSLLVTTGRSGVTIREIATGSVVRIHSGTSRHGARFVYQILTPAQQGGGGATTKIRVLAGPGARVERFEPRVRPILGADEIDSLAMMNVELEVYRTARSARIPAQGTALDTAFLRSVGTLSRPDAHHWGAPTAGQTLALAVGDTALSAVPGVGDAVDVGEFGRAVFTGRDRYNRPVSTVELGIMGIAALLPLVGASALRTVSHGARGATAMAARFGRTVDEMDALLVRAAMLTPQDRAAIGRIDRALRTGARAAAADLRHVRQSLGQLGFVIDLAPSHGDIFLFPDMATTLGRTGARGEVPETRAIHEVGRQAAGVTRPSRHHLLPQEHRQWFEERGFVGEHSIDNYTVALEQASHQAIHGGGNWRLGRQWPGAWNQAIMRELKRLELELQRKLRREEIIRRAKQLMKDFEIDGPLVPYRD